MIFIHLTVTGARFGEVSNLRYEDFDFENETIFIRGGKTVNAKRTVEISHADSQHIQSQIERLRINLNGTFLKRSNTAVKSHFRYALDKAGIKGHKILHSLRHTHITYLIDKGVDDEHVSKRVDHANINITREFYGHRFNSSKESSESIVKDILNSIENNDTL
ncbi:tyrosine-type recombinase/integrase [Jeotgalicoccus meleagridis]|uniref:tyrosine-type recombinase/integrase n=1 Tax=Jeotgalicoccus meleagridis TaxID=2759181 RepID=UPI00161DA744